MTECNFRSQKQFYILYWITLACACLSILGSLFIIISYLSLKKINQGGQYRLIIYLTIADLIFAIQRLIVYDPCQLDIHDPYCKTQSFLQTFSSYSSLIWTFIFTLVLYRENKYEDQPFQIFGCRSQICYLFFGYGLPFILSIVILVTSSFGPLRYWCWISVPHQRQQFHPQIPVMDNQFLQYFWIVLFIFVLWGVIITNLVFYCLIVQLFNKQFRKTQLMLQNSPALGQSIISEQNYNGNINHSPQMLRKEKARTFTQPVNSTSQNPRLQKAQTTKSRTQQLLPSFINNTNAPPPPLQQEIQEQKVIKKRRSFVQSTISRSSIRSPSANALFIYPIILIALWLIPSINRIWTLISPQQNYIALFIIHSICMTLTGFFNSIAYGLNGNVRREIGKACTQSCPCLRQKLNSSITNKNSFLSGSKISANGQLSFSNITNTKESIQRSNQIQSQLKTDKFQSQQQQQINQINTSLQQH